MGSVSHLLSGQTFAVVRARGGGGAAAPGVYDPYSTSAQPKGAGKSDNHDSRSRNLPSEACPSHQSRAPIGEVSDFPPLNDPGNVPFGTWCQGYAPLRGRLWGGQTSKSGVESARERGGDTLVFQGDIPRLIRYPLFKDAAPEARPEILGVFRLFFAPKARLPRVRVTSLQTLENKSVTSRLTSTFNARFRFLPPPHNRPRRGA